MNASRFHAGWFVAFVTLLCLVAQGVAAEPAQRAGLLAEGTPWQTDFVVVDSGEPGPTVMIVGGVHGDEPAGSRAAQQIADWPVLRGRLIVVPSANALGLERGTRKTPADAFESFDLNRAFPVGGTPDHPLAQAIWALVQQHKPDWLIDLHEGYDFHRQNPKSVGASIIFTRGDERVDPAVAAMLKRVNATIEDEDRRLVELGRSGPIAGSLANAAEEMGIRAAILETCKKDQRLPVRVRQHRVMVHTLLLRLGMTDDQAVHRIAPTDAGVTRVAVFDDGGVGGAGRRRVEQILLGDGWVTRRIDATDIRAGALSQFDMIVCSGGSGSGQARALGEDGREKIKAFVSDGGGYVGICAGAYLATAGYDWSLGLIDAKTLHRGAQWRRGTGPVRLQWEELGEQPPAVDAPIGKENAGRLVEVKYANGPIIGPANRDDLGDYTVLAWYRTEITKHDAQPGLMIDTPAIVSGRFGDGRVISISPHPEQTDGVEEDVKRLIAWAVGTDEQ